LQGDNLPAIAFLRLGSSAFWRAIAIANEIENPDALVPGTQLVIPRLPFRDPDTGELFES
jgi:nucleoid-associated protein YgaU